MANKPKTTKNRKEVEPIENKGGRPPFYENSEQLQSKIKEYLDNCPDFQELFTKDGTKYIVPQFTVSGLAYHLGFASRQSFYDYEEREEFSYTIKRARLFIEKEYEKALKTGNAGVIFALKNFGWVDKTEIEQTNIDTSPFEVKIVE